MPKPRKRHATYRLVVFLVFFWRLLPFDVHSAQFPPQDVVVLVDCSDSASPFLPSITQILSRFVSGARLGDSFTCYQFSTNTVLIASGRIKRQGDVEQLKSQLEQLRSGGPYTSYFPALERGLADIKASAVSNAGAERLLLLISDGRRDPQDARSESVTLQDILQRYGDLKSDKESSFYYFSIGDRIEKDVQEYLRAAGAFVARWPENKERLDSLSLTDLRIADSISHLGQFPDTPTHAFFRINFVPRRSPSEHTMIEMAVEAEFAKGTLDRFFDVRPRRIECRQSPWSEKISVETRGFTRGSYSGAFVFQPAEPEALLLSPRRVPFDFSIAESLRVHALSPLSFGPTGFRGAYTDTRSITITPSGTGFPASLDAMSVVTSLQLPEGLDLTISPSMKPREIRVAVTVALRRAVVKQAGGKYEGVVKLNPPAGWAFTQSEIPISVEVAGRGVNLRTVAVYFGLGSICIAAVIAVLFASRNVRTAISDYRAHKARPMGRLIVTDDPTRGIMKEINLGRLAGKKGSKEIIVGVGEEVDVDLPHKSMIDRAYRFSGLRTRDDVHTIVEAIQGADEVIVNNKSRSGQVQLIHLDTVKLGAIEFRYEVPKPLKQVVLYFLDSGVQHGWPLSWDTKTEGFRFLNRADVASRKESYVRFYELKAAAFVRDFDGQLTKGLLSFKVPRAGHRVKIIFADGEEITGYVFDWRNLGDKFYFFPDSMGDNVLFFLIERNTVKDVALLEENPTAAERAQQKFAGILERLKREMGG
jgi:hypothetical protein